MSDQSTFILQTWLLGAEKLIAGSVDSYGVLRSVFVDLIGREPQC